MPSPTTSTPKLVHVGVALSAYSVLNSLLSPRLTAPLPSRSLEIISDLLVKLSSRFGLEQAYLGVFGAGGGKEDGRQDMEPWERTVKELVAVPTKVANAWGARAAAQAVPQGRVGEGVPRELEWR